MTIATPPVTTKPAIIRDRYHRYTFNGAVYPGWTSIGKIVDKSEALITWACRKAVAGVLDQVDALPSMIANNERTELVNMLAKRSAWDRDKAAARGSDIHDHADHIVRGQTPVDVSQEQEKPVAAIAAWWASCGWKLRLSEAYVVNTALGYGGTFDLLAYDEQGRTVIADYKTGRTYPEHRLQLLAYASAEWVTPPGSGVSWPMASVDRYVILLVNDDRVEPVEIVMDDDDLEAFRACVPLARWKATHEKKWRAA